VSGALLLLTAGLTLLTLLQVRFGRALAPLLGAAAGLALALLLRPLARRGRPALRPLLAPALLGLLLMVDPPTFGLTQLAPVAGLQPVEEAALDLRNRPLPAGPAAGVLSSWTFGHQLEVLGRVPVVVNGFGSYPDEAGFWRAEQSLRGSAEALDAYLEANRIGAVVAGPATIGVELAGPGGVKPFGSSGLVEAYLRALPLSPLLIAGSAVPGWAVGHLPHLMPRHASAAWVAGLPFQLPALWTYERVRGATVRGAARPGARVEAELRFSEHRRPHTYRAFTAAGPDGAWTLVLPLPSAMDLGTLRTEARWNVSSGGGPGVEFHLPEAAVRAGTVIEVGALRDRP
jgi:hypothetical protein